MSASQQRGVNTAGDPGFDSDSVGNAETNQWRWLSFPGSRLALNPVPGRDAGAENRWIVPPISDDLRLDLGGFIKNKVFRLMNLLHATLVDPKGEELRAAFFSSTWYPYKISFEAAYAGDARISGADFLPHGGDVFLRILNVEGGRGESLRIGGAIPKAMTAKWDESASMLVFTGETFRFGLSFLRCQLGEGHPLKLSIEPRISATDWTLDIQLLQDSENLGVAFAFVPGASGGSDINSLMNSAIALPLEASLAQAKAQMDALLAKVPVPAVWGCGADKATALTPE